MSLTSAYSRLHGAIIETARDNGLVPHDVRVLLALDERGGTATSEQLYADLLCDGTAVRRSLLTLYAGDYVIGKGVDGKKRRPGIVTRVELDGRGREVLVSLKQQLSFLHEYPRAVAA